MFRAACAFLGAALVAIVMDGIQDNDWAPLVFISSALTLFILDFRKKL